MISSPRPETDLLPGEQAHHSEGRLGARPRRPLQEITPYGVQPLQPGAGRALLYIPISYRSDRPAPLALMLHGAGGAARHGLDLLRSLADDAGLLLLAPQARRPTWDVIGGAFGPDVAVIDGALEQTFERYAVDPKRVAIGGFSDGASYALSLGLINGDLFTHVIAFSPCFAAAEAAHGQPRLFVSHGTRDEVLRINHCSRRLVPRLERVGYDVHYREFDGPHTVPPGIAQEAVTWLMQ
jgi:phospholipase/carboxylesterase